MDGYGLTFAENVKEGPKKGGEAQGVYSIDG